MSSLVTEVKRQALNRLANLHLKYFVKKMMPSYEFSQFHINYIEIINAFAHGKIKNLIISAPPQHGKSEISTRQLIAYLLGLNPNRRVVIASYNDTFAKRFNRENQRIIDTNNYREIFPNTTLNRSNVVTVSTNSLRNSSEFEIVGYNGGLKVVGRGGGLTGTPVDVLVYDDLYKDKEEANSPIVRDSVWDWFMSVANTRLHNDSQQLIVFTRWHEDDLIGRLQRANKVVILNSLNDINTTLDASMFYMINFEAIKTTPPNAIDNRNIGEALFANRHSLDKLLASKELDEENFNCLYQGNPISAKGLLYSTFKTYDVLPHILKIENYTDVADTGSDYLCSITYAIDRNNKQDIYILDIIYSDEKFEVTEVLVADMLTRNNVNDAYIESNNGGRQFARNIERIADNYTIIHPFSQHKNKESRINSNASNVQNHVYMPANWAFKYPTFYEHLTRFKKNFKANKHDDAADTLTGCIEKTQQDTKNDWLI